MTFGRVVTGPKMGQPIAVSFDGNPDWKAGGITLDWSTVPPVAAPVTLADGAVIAAGYSGLQFGAILTKITASGKYGPWSPTNAGTTTVGASVAGATQLTLASGANIIPGDVLTIDTAGLQETGTVLSVAGAVVTFLAPLANAHANGVAVTKANDGRQTLTPGECCVLNSTVLQSGPFLLAPGPTNHPPVIVGGQVWKDRLQVGGTNQPTVAQLIAALPRLQLVEV